MAVLSVLRSHLHPTGRHPERTRERILAAALKEFSAQGFAGARVDRIARRARINKRMLYHYFGNKEHLFREILTRKVRERSAWAVTAPDDAAHVLLAMVALTTFPAAFPPFTRLLTGLKPTDPGFVAQHGAFLRRLAGA